MKRLEKSALQRFAIESAVIVGSILLAFAIDAWWNDRVDRQALVDHLALVEAELVANLKFAESQLEVLNQRIVLINEVLLALSNDEVEPSQIAFMSNLGEAISMERSLRNRHNSIEALKNSSQFGSYDNVEFIKVLNDFTGAVRDAERIADDRSALYYWDVKPALEKNVVMTDLGWTEMEPYSKYDESKIEVTPESKYTSNMIGIRSLDTWNKMFGWKMMQLDYQRALGTYIKSNRELIGKVRTELERLR